jgi:hypothetical protein
LEIQMAQFKQPKAVMGARRPARWSISFRVVVVAIGVGLVSFLATELMHYLLVPDLGGRWERLLAEGVSALLVAVLTAGLMNIADQRREAALLRMQVIAEMNHHIRNALAAISLSLPEDTTQNQQSIRVISDSVDRIEWSLREILLRPKPLPEKEVDRLLYFQSQRSSHPSTYAGREKIQEKTNE